MLPTSPCVLGCGLPFRFFDILPRPHPVSADLGGSWRGTGRFCIQPWEVHGVHARCGLASPVPRAEPPQAYALIAPPACAACSRKSRSDEYFVKGMSVEEAEIFLRGNKYLWHDQRTPKVLHRIAELVRRAIAFALRALARVMRHACCMLSQRSFLLYFVALLAGGRPLRLAVRCRAGRVPEQRGGEICACDGLWRSM